MASYRTAADINLQNSAELRTLSYRVLADFISASGASLKEQLDGQSGGAGSAAERLADR